MTEDTLYEVIAIISRVTGVTKYEYTLCRFLISPMPSVSFCNGVLRSTLMHVTPLIAKFYAPDNCDTEQNGVTMFVLFQNGRL